MQKLVWRNSNGDEIDLTKTPYGITNWEGFSNTSLNIQSQQVPFQDGGVFLDALMEQRELSVTLAIYDGNDLEKRYQYRRELIHILNPKMGEGYLIYTNNFTSKRIKCVAQIPLFETHNSNDSGTPKASLAWTACEPYWEDLNETVLELSEGNNEINVVNNGDIKSQLKIEIFGDIVNPTVRNETTKKKISYNGETGGYLSIDTNIGQKEVLKGDESLSLYSVIPSCNRIFYSKKINSFILYYYNIIYSTKDGKRYEIINFNVEQSYGYVIKELNGKYFISYYLDPYTYISIRDNLSGADLYLIQTSKKINDFAYSETNGLYVAVGNEGVILTSSDLEHWTSQTSGVSEDLLAVMDSKIANKIICCGNNDTLLTSVSGSQWNAQTLPTHYQESINSIAEGNGVILTGRYRSYDGSSWLDSNHQFTNIVFVNYLNVFIFSNGEAVTKTGYNDVKYTNILDVTYRYSLNEIAVDEANNFILGVSENARGAFSSFNSIEWERASFLYNTLQSENVVKKDGYFYGVVKTLGSSENPSSSYISRSVDLVNWEFIQVLSEDSVKYVIKILNDNIVITWQPAPYQAVTNGVAYSSDGSNWVVYEFEEDWRIEDIIYSKLIEKYIAVGKNNTNGKGIILRNESLEESEWSVTEYTLPNYTYFTKVGGNEDIICIIGGAGSNKLFISYDGVSISPITLPTFTYEYTGQNLIYSEVFNKFYAVCTYQVPSESYRNSLLLISENGLDWTISFTGLEGLSSTIGESLVGNKVIVTTNNGYTVNNKTIITYDGENFVEIDIPDNYIPLTIWVMGVDDDKFLLRNQKGQSLEIYIQGVTNYINAISNISADSDIDFGLSIGNNLIRIIKDSGTYTVRLTYRQKYIGV